MRMQNVGVDIKGELKLGVTQTGEIAGGTGLAWTIDLQEGQYASIDYVIESGTMPTLPIIAGPDWAKRLEAEPVEARAGVTVRWLADASGEWHFMLLTLPNAPIRYRLTWKEARAPTEGERRVVIQRSFEASRAIQGQQQFQAYGNAERMMKHAVTLARGLSQPDARTIAVGMGNLGVIHAAMDRPKEADAELREALRAPAGVLDPDDTVPLLYNLAAVRYKLRALGEAQKICEQARQAALAARAPASLPTILSLLGGIQADLGAYGEAEKYFTEAVAAEEKLPNKDPYRQSSLLQNFASLYVDENNYAKADELLRRARTVLESADGADGLLVANLLNWMATIEMERGDFTQAEGHIREAEGIGSRRRNVEVQTQTLRQWGGLHELEGRFSDAKVALEKSLDLLGGADRDSVLRGKVLADLGGIYLRLGDHHRALTALREAQKIFEAAQGPNDIEQCRTLNMMGAALADSVLRSGRAGTAELREAEAEFRRALAVRKQDPTAKYPRAQTILENLAIALLLQNKQDEFAAAMQELARYQSLLGSEARTDMALSMADLGSFFANNARDFSKEELRGVLRSIDVAQEILRKQFRRPERAELVVQFRAARAQVLQRMGDLAGALMEMDEALTGAEALRLPVGGQEESASQYFSRFRKYWDDLVFWRLQNGQTAKAVEDGERVRARLLLAQMQTDMSAIREGIAPEKRHQIERREEEAKRRIASARQRMRSMGTRSDLDEGERQKLLEGAARDEEAAESEYEHVYDEIKNESPAWRRLAGAAGKAANLAEIQDRVVPKQGLALMYVLGTRASVLLTIPPPGGAPKAYWLEVSAEAAGDLGIPAGNLTRQSLEDALQSQGGGAILTQLQQRNFQVVTTKAPLAAQLHALWQALIPAEAWADIQGRSEVLILPDAALHKLPFEAMVTRKGGTAAATGYWLDDGPPVRYAASATIVLALAARPVGGASDGSVLSVSDPAYQAAEARTAPAASRLWAELGGSARMATGLPPLPGTKRETEEIIKRFAGKVTWLQGPDATEGNLRASIAGMQYVHLATHGLVDESRGALFSALALAPPAHAAVSTDDDGFLELHEVYSLNLKSCELAILSACQTNAGHQIEGEGVFALSRGFLAAGAARVIASQWPVDDISTAAAVGDFFGRIGMASKQNGGYARALREAKKTIRNQAQWAAPYFWAPWC